jgi:hypothetical protein
LKKGDLGGFENLQGERIYGKGYIELWQKIRPMASIPLCHPERKDPGSIKGIRITSLN